MFNKETHRKVYVVGIVTRLLVHRLENLGFIPGKEGDFSFYPSIWTGPKSA